MKKTTFLKIFGTSPQIKLLNYLLINKEVDHSLTEISRESGVAWTTMNLLWQEFENNKIVIHTRNVGKAKMYKLNNYNPHIKELIEFNNKIN